LHSGVGHPFGGIAKVVGMFLKPRLKQISFLASSTDDVTKTLQNLTVPPHARDTLLLVKADIKDFFIQGEPPELCENLFDGVASLQTKRALEDIVRLILTSQFVFDPSTGKTYRVLKGSGIGQVLSGDLANTKFYNLAERVLCQPYNLACCRVLCYIRYFDDIFIACYRHADMKHMHFLRSLKKLAGSIYELKVECMGQSIDFLDLSIYKPADFHSTGKLAFRPFVKPSGQRQYLAPSSAHPPSVHRAWPLAELGRMYARSSSMLNYASAKKHIIMKFACAMLDPKLVEELQDWEPRPKARVVKGRTQWIVCKYHPCVAKILNSALNQYKFKWLELGYKPPFEFKICWSRAGKNLAENVAFVQSF
jgi:hypothetical protein